MRLSARALPNHPGMPGGCARSLLPHRLQASPYPASWPHPLCVTRPNRVRLTRAHAFAVRGYSPPRPHLGGDRPASQVRLPSPERPPLHGERPITMADSFQPARRTRLRLAHRISRITRIQRWGENWAIGLLPCVKAKSCRHQDGVNAVSFPAQSVVVEGFPNSATTSNGIRST